MERFQPPRPIVASASVVVAFLAVFALLASGVLGAGKPGVRVPGSPVPSAPAVPSAPPSDEPSDHPAPIAPSGPADDASDGIDKVNLANWPGVDSSVVVWDESDSLADASSGEPGRPGSVSYKEVKVVHVDDDTLRLTWADLPIDNVVRVSIRRADDGTYLVRIVRPVPQQPNDGVVTDRVLVLDFGVAIPATDVAVTLIDNLEPSGTAGVFDVGLASSSGSGLHVLAWDETDGLKAAKIGSIDSVATVGINEVEVDNVDADTIRLTWTSLPIASEARLSIRMADDGTYEFRLVRLQPRVPADGTRIGRVLLLDFNVAVLAADVNVKLIDALANNG
jgi:hypothetical protein